MIAASSRTYVEAQRSFEQKGFLKKARGWWCCERMAPIPALEASVSITNGAEKSGRAKIGAWHKASFSLEKAMLASRVQ